MQLLTHRPPRSLRQHIEYFWTFSCPQDGPFDVRLFVDGASGIVIQHSDGGYGLSSPHGTTARAPVAIPKAFVYGPRTQPGHLVARGPLQLTGAAFRPHTLHALLKIDAAEMSRRGPVHINDVFNRQLEDHVLNAGAAPERLAVLGQHLTTYVGDAREDLLISDSVRLLTAEVRTLRIPEVLTRLEISERQFERRFKRAVGLSPHRYLRVLRFRQAVRLMRDHERMLNIAAELNYADQSHFIKEVKRLSGYTPTDLVGIVRTSVHLPCALLVPEPLGISAETHGA